MTRRVWDVPGLGFGDLWSALHFCHHQSIICEVPSFVCSLYGDQDVTSKLHEMLSLIEAPGCVVPTKEPPTDHMHMESFGVPYFPSKIRWAPSESNRVAYQFDGRSSAHLKNPPESEIASFLSFTKTMGMEARRVGDHLSMGDCALEMASARAFVGVCSGMALLAHSVGVPTFILEYDLDVRWWHGQNAITICRGMPRFLRQFPWSPS